MNKTFTKIIVGIFIFCSSTLHAQLPNWCHASEVSDQAMQNDPALRLAHDQLEAFTAQRTNGNFQTEQRGQSVVYIIPVVFHIIHQWGPENITDAQVYDAVRIMNRDFRKLNPDTNLIIPSFTAIAADCEIEFRLAQLDPNGNCTNGIDRIASPLTYDGGDNAKLNPWPSNQYLNIWTVNVFGASHAGAAAYAYYPGSAPAGKDGVISLYDYVGSIAPSSITNSRTLTHEVGHCLNLQHVWGSTNQPGVACGNDGVNDTPITMGYTTCPQPANADICTAGVIENYQNYMDYSYCSRMFTQGQKARMVAALQSAVGGRNNLWTSTNLTSTGTDGTVYTCVPTALFNGTYTRYVCVGQNITFYDFSLNTDSLGTTYLWTFNGGTSSTTTQKNATVQYAAPGIYDVTLTVTNSAGSDSYTATGIVIVSAPVGAVTAPVIEGFETLTVPGNDWYINNAGGNTFQNSTLAAHTGSQCLRLQNYTGNISGTTDELMTTSFSLVGNTSSKVWFWYSYANRNTGSDDSLKVFGSTDCGQTWQLKLQRAASQIATVPNTSVNFTPTLASQWKQDSASLLSYNNQPNVRLKFRFSYDSGNNFYLDDINISGLVGLEDYNIESSEITLSPNPASHGSLLAFALLNDEQVTINVMDVMGREVEKVMDKKLEAGEYEYQLNTHWSKGIYFVRIVAGNQYITKKLIVE